MLQYLMHNLHKLPKQFKDAIITDLKLFKQVRDVLTINDQSIIMIHGNRLVIPKAL